MYLINRLLPRRPERSRGQEIDAGRVAWLALLGEGRMRVVLCIMLGRQRVCCTQLAELFWSSFWQWRLLRRCAAKTGPSGVDSSETAYGAKRGSSKSFPLAN